MCQFVSFTPQLLPFLLAGKREGGAGGVCYKGVEGGGWLRPAQGQASLCGQRVTRWSGSTAGHGANVPPLLPSADKAINPGLLWASAALNLWAFTAYCSVGLTLPAGGSTLCTSRTGKEFKLRVKYVEDFMAMRKLNFNEMTMAPSGLAVRFPTGRMFLHWYAFSSKFTCSGLNWTSKRYMHRIVIILMPCCSCSRCIKRYGEKNTTPTWNIPNRYWAVFSFQLKANTSTLNERHANNSFQKTVISPKMSTGSAIKPEH